MWRYYNPFGHCQLLLDKCSKFAQKWKIYFNPSKSAAIFFHKGKCTSEKSFTLNGHEIPKTQNVEYLGLPIGDNNFTWKLIEEKWKKVEKCFYSLYGIGCKSKSACFSVTSFLYKQFCQSIFRYNLDFVYLTEKRLKELEKPKKFARIRPLLETLYSEMAEQLCIKHKIFFLKQLRNSSVCWNILTFLRGNYKE